MPRVAATLSEGIVFGIKTPLVVVLVVLVVVVLGTGPSMAPSIATTLVDSWS